MRWIRVVVLGVGLSGCASGPQKAERSSDAAAPRKTLSVAEACEAPKTSEEELACIEARTRESPHGKSILAGRVAVGMTRADIQMVLMVRRVSVQANAQDSSVAWMVRVEHELADETAWDLAEPGNPSVQRFILDEDGVSWVGTKQEYEQQLLGTRMYIDTRTGQLTRQAPTPPPSTAELLQAWRGLSGERERDALIRQLLARSEETGIGNDAGLSRFWWELLSAPRSPGRKPLRAAVKALALTASDEELRQLARLPAGPPERNLALLTVLVHRVPAEARTYALHVLSEQWAPEQLRENALRYLVLNRGAETESAVVLALKDPAPIVRVGALTSLVWSLPMTGISLERMLPSCQDPDARVRKEGVEGLKQLLLGVNESLRPRMLDGLRSAGEAGRLKCFPEGWIILAGVADLESNRAQALELYARGLEAMEALDAARQEQSRALVLEARLQLAFEAKKKGELKEVERHVHKVLADERNRTQLVCAPWVHSYAGPEACQEEHQAQNVVRMLLEERGH